MAKKKTKKPAAADLDLRFDLEITKSSRRASGAGTWVSGTLHGHRFDALVFPEHAENPDYEIGDKKVPSVHVSASKSQDGKTHVSLVNALPDREAKVTLKLSGLDAKKAAGRIITADKLDAHNTFDQPNAVKPAAFEKADVKGDSIALTLPAKSVVVLEVQ